MLDPIHEFVVWNDVSIHFGFPSEISFLASLISEGTLRALHNYETIFPLLNQCMLVDFHDCGTAMIVGEKKE